MCLNGSSGSRVETQPGLTPCAPQEPARRFRLWASTSQNSFDLLPTVLGRWHGHVAAYGQLANRVPQPTETSDDDYRVFGSRWAGLAMAACPDDVRWHRVLDAQGKISQSRNPPRNGHV